MMGYEHSETNTTAAVYSFARFGEANPSFVITLAGLLGFQGLLLYVLGAQGTLTLTEDMTLARAAVLAYGDASRAAELAERNAIDDVLLIPAGTVLVI